MVGCKLWLEGNLQQFKRRQEEEAKKLAGGKQKAYRYASVYILSQRLMWHGWIHLCYYIYHTSNSRECMRVNGEALQLHSVYKKPYFLLQVTCESVSVLQVTWESISVLQVTLESVSGIASERALKLYDKIIITKVPSYTGKNTCVSLICCRWHCYSCCTHATMYAATNTKYFPV